MYLIKKIIGINKMKTNENKLYFAYGSNMSEKQMGERCGNVKCFGKAVLKGYRVVERLYADINLDADAVTEGVLYELNTEQIEKLDKREGVKKEFYYRFEVPVEIDGQIVNALVYKLTDKKRADRTGIPYPDDYRQTCSDGADAHGVKNIFKKKGN